MKKEYLIGIIIGVISNIIFFILHKYRWEIYGYFDSTFSHYTNYIGSNFSPIVIFFMMIMVYNIVWVLCYTAYYKSQTKKGVKPENMISPFFMSWL